MNTSPEDRSQFEVMPLGAEPVVPLVYQSPMDAVRPMSRLAAGWVLGMSVVPTTFGIAILLAFRVTAFDALPMVGFYWLAGGGAMTFVLGVIAVVNLIRAISRQPKDPVVVRRYGWTIAACAVACVAAYGCARLGVYWMEMPRFTLTVTNATSTPLERLVVHFSGGDVDAGPVSARQSVVVGRVWTTQHGPLDITTTVNGHTRRKADRPSFNIETRPGSGATRPVEVIVETSELPKSPVGR